jgi:cobalt-zinc-cadmium efflux system outer membrane protein
MKHIKLWIGLFLFFTTSLLAAQDLSTYLLEAALNNPGLKVKYQEFEIAMKQVSQVNSLPDPTLSFGYFISPVETRVGPQRAKLSLSQMFPWFGSLKAAGNGAEFMAEAKYQDFLQAKNELYKQVKLAWYPIIQAKEEIRLQEENVRILSSFRTLAETSFKNNKASLVDVLRADILLEESKTALQLLNQKLSPLKNTFSRLLNRPIDAALSINDSLGLFDIDSNYRRDSMLVNNPSLQAFDEKSKSLVAKSVLVQKQAMPKIGLGLDYVIVGERSDMNPEGNGQDVIMPMVSLSLPIFTTKNRAKKEEVNLAMLQIDYAKEAYQNKLLSDYDMAIYNAEKAYQLLTLFQKQSKRVKQVIDILIQEYSNSGKDFEEVLKAQQQYLTFKTKELDARVQFNMALAQLDFLTAKNID